MASTSTKDFITPYSELYLKRRALIEKNRESAHQKYSDDVLESRSVSTFRTHAKNEQELYKSHRTFGEVPRLGRERSDSYSEYSTERRGRSQERSLSAQRSSSQQSRSRSRSNSVSSRRSVSSVGSNSVTSRRSESAFQKELQLKRTLAAQQKERESLELRKREAYLQFLKGDNKNKAWVPSGPGPKHKDSTHVSINSKASTRYEKDLVSRRHPSYGLINPPKHEDVQPIVDTNNRSTTPTLARPTSSSSSRPLPSDIQRSSSAPRNPYVRDDVSVSTFMSKSSKGNKTSKTSITKPLALSIRIIDSQYRSKYGILILRESSSSYDLKIAIEEQFSVFKRISDISLANRYSYSGQAEVVSISQKNMPEYPILTEHSEIVVYLDGLHYFDTIFRNEKSQFALPHANSLSKPNLANPHDLPFLESMAYSTEAFYNYAYKEDELNDKMNKINRLSSKQHAFSEPTRIVSDQKSDSVPSSSSSPNMIQRKEIKQPLPSSFSNILANNPSNLYNKRTELDVPEPSNFRDPELYDPSKRELYFENGQSMPSPKPQEPSFQQTISLNKPHVQKMNLQFIVDDSMVEEQKDQQTMLDDIPNLPPSKSQQSNQRNIELQSSIMQLDELISVAKGDYGIETQNHEASSQDLDKSALTWSPVAKASNLSFGLDEMDDQTNDPLDNKESSLTPHSKTLLIKQQRLERIYQDLIHNKTDLNKEEDSKNKKLAQTRLTSRMNEAEKAHLERKKYIEDQEKLKQRKELIEKVQIKEKRFELLEHRQQRKEVQEKNLQQLTENPKINKDSKPARPIKGWEIKRPQSNYQEKDDQLDWEEYGMQSYRYPSPLRNHQPSPIKDHLTRDFNRFVSDNSPSSPITNRPNSSEMASNNNIDKGLDLPSKSNKLNNVPTYQNPTILEDSQLPSISIPDPTLSQVNTNSHPSISISQPSNISSPASKPTRKYKELFIDLRSMIDKI